MRINKYLAQGTGISRRMADDAVAHGRVKINGGPAEPGSSVGEYDRVTLDGRPVEAASKIVTILLHKPVGYVVSREGQGSQTVYDLLPEQYRLLKPVGRLDKDSSGLLLLTNDGQLAQELTHPSFAKRKVYEVTLNKALEPLHRQMIQDHGITLDDGISKLQLDRLREGNEKAWIITMHEGRNRQIRRTFSALGYCVTHLHRITLGQYNLDDLKPGDTTLLARP